jgi:hypothetical protein
MLGKVARHHPQILRELRAGDVMTVYHPKSGLPTTVEHLEQYRQRTEVAQNQTSSLCPANPEAKPWHPFAQLLDFEFAEVALDAHLNQSQIEKILKIINKVASPDAAFTLRSYQQLQKTWELASTLQTPVSINHSIISAHRGCYGAASIQFCCEQPATALSLLYPRFGTDLLLVAAVQVYCNALQLKRVSGVPS